LAELLGALPAGPSLAIEAPVADLAGRTIGERTRLAHAALIGLLAKANPSGDQAGWGNGTRSGLASSTRSALTCYKLMRKIRAIDLASTSTPGLPAPGSDLEIGK